MTNKELFFAEYDTAIEMFGKIKKIMVVVKLPSGATEIIINTEDLENKMNYYKSAYDDEMKLRTNPDIQIIRWVIV